MFSIKSSFKFNKWQIINCNELKKSVLIYDEKLTRQALYAGSTLKYGLCHILHVQHHIFNFVLFLNIMGRAGSTVCRGLVSKAVDNNFRLGIPQR